MTFRIAAVIAAAGLSSRMGRFKPLLPFGESTAIEKVIDAFAGSRVAPIIVVGGHRFRDLEKVVSGTAARYTFNPNYRQGMFSSFKHGFSALPGDAGGLRDVLTSYSDRFRCVEVNHPGILWDMDEMEDYHRLIALNNPIPL